MKGFQESENIRKMWTAQAFEHVGLQDFENAFLEHLGVSDVDFDPENGFRTGKVAKGEINCANLSTCAVVKRSDRCDDVPNSS